MAWGEDLRVATKAPAVVVLDTTATIAEQMSIVAYLLNHLYLLLLHHHIRLENLLGRHHHHAPAA